MNWNALSNLKDTGILSDLSYHVIQDTLGVSLDPSAVASHYHLTVEALESIVVAFMDYLAESTEC